VDNAAHGLWKSNARGVVTPIRGPSSCAALLKALQQIGLVDEEFNILPPPNARTAADPGRPPH